MTESSDLAAFAEDFSQDIVASSYDHEDAAFLEDLFTLAAVQYLADAGEVEDADICFHRAYGVKANGFNMDFELGRLSILISDFTQSVPPARVQKADVEAGFRRAIGFVRKAYHDYHLELEESSPAFDMALTVRDLKPQTNEIRVYYLTDGLTTVGSLPEGEIDGIRTTLQIWDLLRFFRLHSSGRQQEAIEIDFSERFGTAIPYLEVPAGDGDYTTFLATVPGEILAKLYGEFGARLLEQNVRAFLQARGAVNQGIRRTILQEPSRFLAYNNGITATAEWVQKGTATDGTHGITRLRNLQIVNGGQTTASLYHTQSKDKADLRGIHVQAKLAVVDGSVVDKIVPLISRYANSQNKVNEADFSANDPFHVRIEELSRTVWAPAPAGTKEQSKWFYERARGQYADEKNRQRTPARKRAFSAIYPSRQKFTKTDLAKFAHCWDQLPHIVSRGAQKNFREFTLRLDEQDSVTTEVSDYQELIGKAILFRSTERLVSSLKFGGYRANIVAYTIAYLSHVAGQRIDLSEIWSQQAIGPGLQEAVLAVAPVVWRSITSAPGGKNVTEWCKSENCWDVVQKLEVPLPETFFAEPTPTAQRSVTGAGALRERPIRSGSSEPSLEEQEEIARSIAIPAETWFEVSHWGRETGHLQGWQRSLAYTMGRVVSNGWTPSPKQAKQGLRLLDIAVGHGFSPSAGM